MPELLSREEIDKMPEQASCGSFQDDSWAPERIAATLKEQAERVEDLEAAGDALVPFAEDNRNRTLNDARKARADAALDKWRALRGEES